MLICDWCFKGWHMGYFMPPLKKKWLKIGFTFGAQNKPIIIFSHCDTCFC
jgi:hypothetical protein